MLRTLILATLTAVASITALDAPARADPTTVAAWAANVGHKIDARLKHDEATPPAGSATIYFRRSNEGRPVDINIRSASSDEFAAFAVKSAMRLRNLPSLPIGVPSATQIALKLLIGDGNRARYNAERQEMRQIADVANQKFETRVADQQLAGLDPR